MLALPDAGCSFSFVKHEACLKTLKAAQTLQTLSSYKGITVFFYCVLLAAVPTRYTGILERSGMKKRAVILTDISPFLILIQTSDTESMSNFRFKKLENEKTGNELISVFCFFYFKTEIEWPAKYTNPTLSLFECMPQRVPKRDVHVLLRRQPPL